MVRVWVEVSVVTRGVGRIGRGAIPGARHARETSRKAVEAARMRKNKVL